MKKLICSPPIWLIFTGAAILATIFTDLNPYLFVLSLLFFLVAVLAATRQSPPREKLALNLSAQTEEKLKSADFSDKTVMVGTVRTAEQLDYCLKPDVTMCLRRFYKMPPSLPFISRYTKKKLALSPASVGTVRSILWNW